MSDTEPQSPDSPKPSTKTSTVPLKKETVRITLRARPEESGPVAPKGGTAPVAAKGGTEPVSDTEASTAPVEVSEETGPTEAVAPAAPPPPAAAPTPPPAPAAPTPPPAPAAPSPPPATPAPAPPAAAGAPPVGAKTIPLAKKPASPSPAGAPIGAKTIPLAKAPAAGGPATGKQTTPLTPGGGGARPLPKATVKLQKTQPMGEGGVPEKTISQSPDIKSTASDVEEEWEEDFEEGGVLPFAIIVLLLAIVVLVIQFLTMNYQPPA